MKSTASDASAGLVQSVQQLVDVAKTDTVYGDVYIGRARQLLGGLLPPAQYAASKRIEADIAQALGECKAATVLQDWQRVETLAGHAETLRQSAQQNAALNALGAKVYDRSGVSLDPFSPGFESLPGHDADLAEVRDGLVAALKGLAAADAASASFYDARRAFFAGYGLLPKRAAASKAAAAPAAGAAQLQQLAAQAAQQGDMAQLRRYARELQAQQTAAKTETASAGAATPAVERGTYGCPVDLSLPFAAEAVQRGRALGLSAMRGEPLPQAGPLFDYVAAHVWQANLAGAESEREGTLRTAAAVDAAGLPQGIAEPVKVLIGQFLRNPLANSGGARYLPRFGAEEILAEDFPEDQEPPSGGALLEALGLPQRRGLARVEIDDALQQHGASIVGERLGLDPLEYRLVCMPHDLYMRCGRERGWGKQQLWTHFDGYQVLKNGALRALIGGDVRYGGLTDLLSVATTDRRDAVIVRLAVVRRARQVARWH